MGEAEEEGGGAEANGEPGRARTRPRGALAPPSGSGARAFPGSRETRAGRAQPGARREAVARWRAAGAGDCGGGRCGARARAPSRLRCRSAPGRVAARARAQCSPAVRAGRDAEVKFGREGEIRQREGSRAANTESSSGMPGRRWLSPVAGGGGGCLGHGSRRA